VAFRRDGVIWVSSETGANARSVAVSTDGAFSLSPDGETIAVVDSASGILSVIAVASGATVVVGPASQSAPVWAPDSTWLVYRADTGGRSDLLRGAREGGPPRPLGPGTSPSISPDGAWVYAVRPDSAGERHVARIPAGGGTATDIPSGRSVIGVSETGANAFRVFFARPGAGGGSPTIGSMTPGGADVATLVKAPLSAPDVSFTSLRPSPDGGWLAYQESGDDGYSRLYCIRVAGGDPVRLWIRYDTYAIGWSADGSELLFAEGNTILGEASRVVAVHPDGTGRRVIAENAGL
jgi:Tol biopolymer transport system component